MTPQGISRKDFILLTVSLVSGAGIATCGNDGGGSPTGSGGTNGSGGTGGQAECSDPLGAMQNSDSTGHTHTVMVPRAALDSASAMMFTTSSASNHTHTITLSTNNLSTIRAGGSVTVTSSSDSNHTHAFRVRCMG
jgi:hypothetical protein